MYSNTVYAGSVLIISAKKPKYSLLCTEDMDNLTTGERLSKPPGLSALGGGV